MAEHSLAQETLLKLRALLREMQSEPATGKPMTPFPLEEVMALAAELEQTHGITIDLAATQELGQPMVVVRLPQTPTPDPRLERLSPREREVAALVARGLRNKEIAAQLHISLSTVKDHVHNILDKLEISGRTALAALFFEG